MRVGQQLEMYVHGCRYGYSVHAHRGVPADVGKSFKLTVMADNTLCLKKQDTTLLPITSPNVNRFSKFFHWQTHW